jgi:hypothetical protein
MGLLVSALALSGAALVWNRPVPSLAASEDARTAVPARKAASTDLSHLDHGGRAVLIKIPRPATAAEGGTRGGRR